MVIGNETYHDNRMVKVDVTVGIVTLRDNISLWDEHETIGGDIDEYHISFQTTIEVEVDIANDEYDIGIIDNESLKRAVRTYIRDVDARAEFEVVNWWY